VHSGLASHECRGGAAHANIASATTNCDEQRHLSGCIVYDCIQYLIIHASFSLHISVRVHVGRALLKWGTDHAAATNLSILVEASPAGALVSSKVGFSTSALRRARELRPLRAEPERVIK
jgi:hypothetical protein